MSNECSWVRVQCCYQIRSFWDFMMSNTIEKLIVTCFVSLFNNASRLIQNDTKLLHNHHEHTRLSYKSKIINHLIRVEFFHVLYVSFLFTRRSRKRRWSNHSSRSQNVESINVHFLRCSQDWNSLQLRSLRRRKIHWLKFTLDIVDAFQQSINLKWHDWTNKIE